MSEHEAPVRSFYLRQRERISHRGLPRAQALAKRLGFALYPYREQHDYAPSLYSDKHVKLLDIRTLPDFGEAAREVVGQGRSYLGYSRLYTLWQAMMQLGEGSVAELGVYRGGSSYFLARIANERWRGRKVYGFDTFTHFPDVNPALDGPDRDAPIEPTADDVRRYLSRFDNYELREGVFPDTAAGLEQEVFALVHVDSDTYSSYVAAFEFFAPRLSPGALMVLDDYGFTTTPGARRATDEFVERQGSGFVFLHLVTGQGLLVKTAG